MENKIEWRREEKKKKLKRKLVPRSNPSLPNLYFILSILLTNYFIDESTCERSRKNRAEREVESRAIFRRLKFSLGRGRGKKIKIKIKINAMKQHDQNTGAVKHDRVSTFRILGSNRPHWGKSDISNIPLLFFSPFPSSFSSFLPLFAFSRITHLPSSFHPPPPFIRSFYYHSPFPVLIIISYVVTGGTTGSYTNNKRYIHVCICMYIREREWAPPILLSRAVDKTRGS